MRWIIREWPGPSADGLGPRMALNTARPSTDPPMAQLGQAIHGCQAIRGWPGSAYGPEQGPEEILERRSTLTSRLKEAARVERRGGRLRDRSGRRAGDLEE